MTKQVFDVSDELYEAALMDTRPVLTLTYNNGEYELNEDDEEE